MPIRIGVGLFGLIIFIISFSFYISAIKKDAFNAGVASVVKEVERKTELAIKKQEKINYVLLEEDSKDIQTVVVTKTEVKNEIKEVTVYVTKEIVVPSDCTEFAASVVGMLSKTTSIINDAAERKTN